VSQVTKEFDEDIGMRG